MNGIELEKVGPLTLRAWGLATALVVWGLYLLTLAPTVGFWDSSEYVTTAHILGLPHPPGNPFFVLVGRVWDLLLGFTGLPVALRINALGATLSAGASFFWFLAVARIVGRFRENRHEVLVAAIVGVWVGATTFTVWTQSSLNEKVYPLSMFVVALVSYLAMAWMDEADTARGNRLLLLIALVLGLGWASHTMSLLPGLALAAFVLVHRWRAALNPRVLGLGILLLAVGYSMQFLFVPIRSAENPIIDEADPECPTLVSAITPKRITDRYGQSKLAVACESLALSLIRDQYAPPPITQRQAPLSAQMANYWQYLDWQWARSLPPGGRLAASILFLFLALVGLRAHLRSDRKTFVYAGTLLFTVTLLLVYYLNFKYGYSIYREEVRHGLAFKLVDAPLEASETLVDLTEHVAAPWVPTWNDRARTGALLEDVYLVDDLLEMEEWPEPSSRSSVPSACSMAHAFQGVSEELHGNVEAAARAYRRANHFGRLAGGGD